MCHTSQFCFLRNTVSLGYGQLGEGVLLKTAPKGFNVLEGTAESDHLSDNGGMVLTYFCSVYYFTDYAEKY